MALSRIRCSRDLPTVLSRYTHPVTGSLGETHATRHGLDTAKSAEPRTKSKNLHVSGVRRYPEAPRLPLPNNVSEIFGNETGRFTPERARDIAAPVLAYVTSVGSRDGQTKRAFDANCASWGPARASCGDSHVDSYDCFGAVSLNSSMQSNVPIPFCSSGKASHFNMPGGQWAKDSKYIAEDLQNSHYKSVKARESERKRRGNGPLTNAVFVTLTPVPSTRHECFIAFSTDSSASAKNKNKMVSAATTTTTTDTTATTDSGKTADSVTAAATLSKVAKLEKAVKDYGSTVVVFHIGISLISLGACYVAVSSGLDVGAFFKTISFFASERFDNAMANSSNFLIAYALHKIFAPARISLTLAATPFVVKYLRRVGILKMSKA